MIIFLLYILYPFFFNIDTNYLYPMQNIIKARLTRALQFTIYTSFRRLTQHRAQASTLFEFLVSLVKMASFNSSSSTITTFKFHLGAFLLLVGVASAQLASNFYGTSCPSVLSVIKSAVDSAVSNEARMGASLLRLHFHDCFVNASCLPFFFFYHHLPINLIFLYFIKLFLRNLSLAILHIHVWHITQLHASQLAARN
jgi:hypothetical protein